MWAARPSTSPGSEGGAGILPSETMKSVLFDFVAVGRAMLSDAAWAMKVREGRFADLKPFTRKYRKRSSDRNLKSLRPAAEKPL